ncbi:hypothetical protein Tco_0903396 [Tanacetum coccineum]
MATFPPTHGSLWRYRLVVVEMNGRNMGQDWDFETGIEQQECYQEEFPETGVDAVLVVSNFESMSVKLPFGIAVLTLVLHVSQH